MGKKLFNNHYLGSCKIAAEVLGFFKERENGKMLRKRNRQNKAAGMNCCLRNNRNDIFYWKGQEWKKCLDEYVSNITPSLFLKIHKVRETRRKECAKPIP